MEETVLSAQDARDLREFQRIRRETEISLSLKKLVVDAKRREVDRHALRRACESAKKLGAAAVVVSPVFVATARKELGKQAKSQLCCEVGGTGETLLAVKKTEAKKVVRAGAEIIRLVPCYSRLFAGNKDYVKREVKAIRRAAKKCTVVLSLEDRALGEKQLLLGIRAAIEGKAHAVCVRGESEILLKAVEACGEKLSVEVSGVENAEQLRLLLKAGAVRFQTTGAERIAEEMTSRLEGAV